MYNFHNCFFRKEKTSQKNTEKSTDKTSPTIFLVFSATIISLRGNLAAPSNTSLDNCLSLFHISTIKGTLKNKINQNWIKLNTATTKEQFPDKKNCSKTKHLFQEKILFPSQKKLFLGKNLFPDKKPVSRQNPVSRQKTVSRLKCL